MGRTTTVLQHLRLSGGTGSSRGGRLLAPLALAVFVLTLSVGTQSAYAAAISVNTTTDELNADGDCSVREAIQAANTNTAVDACPAGSGADVISVPAGTYTLAITGMDEDANATGDLDVLDGLTLTGVGVGVTIIDGNNLDRVLHVVGVTVVQVSGLTARNGGGGVCRGAGIYNGGTLTLHQVTVSDNQTGPVCSGAVVGGGGIVNTGTLTVNDSAITGNIAALQGFASLVGGGGILNTGMLVVNNSAITGNSHPVFSPSVRIWPIGGGGILNTGTLVVNGSSMTGNNVDGARGGGVLSTGSLTVEGSTISNNPGFSGGGVFDGGGVYVSGTGILENSTVSGNFAVDRGGGIFSLDTLTLTNVTISSNSTTFEPGGGIYVFGTATLTSVTMSGNDAGSGADSIYAFSGATVNVAGTIVADSPQTDCESSSLTSLGYNLVETTGCIIGGPQSGDLEGVDPALGPLANNGGPTFTHALFESSPAIDAGSPACPPPATDQRGVSRPQGAACDIGAFELEQLQRDILFASSRTGKGDIYAIDPDGGTPTQLTSGNAIDAEPEWSPDGSKIAFTSTRDGNVEIYVMDADGTDVTRLTTNARVDTSPAWYGTKIAFASNRANGNWDIYTMDADDGGNVTRLTTHGAADTLPAWSPNGAKIAFSSSRTGGGDIYSMNADGTFPARLTTSSGVDTEPAWAGSTIAFSTNRDGNFEIYTMNDNGTMQTRRTTQAGQDVTPAWSPDESKLAFATNRHGTFNFEIYTMDADGTDQTRLTMNPALDVFPDW